MKKTYLYLILFTGILLPAIIPVQLKPIQEEEPLKTLTGVHPGWFDQWFEMKKNKDGKIIRPPYEQWNDFDRRALNKRGTETTGLHNVKELGPNNVGGRTRDLIIDYANDQRILSAAVSGGLWESKNMGKSWKQHDDLAQNMNITGITQSPFQHNIIYYATGEAAGNSGGAPGDGIFKSVDGGETFTQLKSSLQGQFNYIWDIEHSLVDSHTFYVATRRDGVYRSTNGGDTLELVFSYNQDIHDMALFPDGSIMLAVESRGIFYSESGDLNSFALLSNTGLPAGGFNRIEIEYCETKPNVVYALIAKGLNNSGECVGVWRSTDKGESWEFRNNPETNRIRFNANWYTLAMGVDPVDSNKVVVGSVGLGYSVDGGKTWQPANQGHADEHIFKFRRDVSNTFLAGGDGGIYEYNWSTIATRHIDKNDGYNVTQFYAGTYMPDSLGMLAGTQDNGTQYTDDGDLGHNHVLGGDGAFCHIDQENPKIAYASTQNGAIRKTSALNLLQPGWGRVAGAMDQNRDNTIDDGAWFINPFEMNYKNAQQVFFPTRSRLWMTFDGTGSWYPITNFKGSLYSVGIPNEPDPKRVYVGGGGMQLWHIPNPSNLEPGNETSVRVNLPQGLSNSFVVNIAVHPRTDKTIFVSLSNYSDEPRLWRIDSAHTSDPIWTSLGDNLPAQLPVNWVVVDPYRPDSFFVAATDFGLYTTKNAGRTWVKDERIPNVPVHNLRLRESDRKVFIFTHGRGAFAADLDYMENPFVSAPEPETFNLSVYPNPSSDYVQVELEGDFRYFIYSTDGRLVKQGRAERQIDIRRFAPGQYVLEVQRGQQVRKQLLLKR